MTATNRLTNEHSLYLQQHANQPVAWWPWGEAAFAAAREQGRPVFVSIGYSSCHWCHVMAHESFDDAATAEQLNTAFICIKVDREERPDIDAIFIEAVQAMGSGAGWPLSVFCTPDGKPFWGGTYFPPQQTAGMPSFRQVLTAIEKAWNEDRERLESASAELVTQLMAANGQVRDENDDTDDTDEHDEHAGVVDEMLDPTSTDRAVERLLSQHDRVNGGFEIAPKFPPPLALNLLMTVDVRRTRHATRDTRLQGAVAMTLDGMLHGGIYDQLEGGFHRYSVDDTWRVPHFEKMLYDNALMIGCLANAVTMYGEITHLRALHETLTFVLHRLALPNGGFAAAIDADTDGDEGATYMWTHAQIVDALGADDGAWLAQVFGVPDDAPSDARFTLALSRELNASEWRRLEPLRTQLANVRAQRPQPATDAKTIAAWNGLMLDALCSAAATLAATEQRHDELVEYGVTPVPLARVHEAAQELGDHLVQRHMQDSTLYRTWHGSERRGIVGTCDDWAAVAIALVSLWETTFEQRWLTIAGELCEHILAAFDDPVRGGFFATAQADPLLTLRPRDITDHPTPSGNSLAAAALLRVAQYIPERAEGYAQRARAALELVAPAVERAPSALAYAASGIESATHEARNLVVVGAPDDAASRALCEVVRERYLPDVTVVCAPEGDPLLDGRTQIRGNTPTAYLCAGSMCHAPVTSPDELRALLEHN